MRTAHLHNLSHFTKLVLLVLIVIATELDSNLALYGATAIWLELTYIINIERKALAWLAIKWSAYHD